MFGLMATSTQQRPAAAGRNPRSRGARDARRSGPDKLRAAAHARPATSRSPEAAGARDARSDSTTNSATMRTRDAAEVVAPWGVGMITCRARETIRKRLYFCEFFKARGADCAQRAEEFAKVRLLRKRSIHR